MLVFEVPYRNPVVTSFLPNPDFGDEELKKQETRLKRSMDGTLYTYNQRNIWREVFDEDPLLLRHRQLNMTWSNMTKAKMHEVIYLVDNYGDQFWKMITKEGVHWRVTLQESPVPLNIEKRTERCYESGTLELKFFANKLGIPE